MFVDITLDQPRKLRFDLSAFRALEDAMDGQPVGVMVARLQQLSVRALGVMLWTGLKHEDSKLTLGSVERLLNDYVEQGGDVTEIVRSLSDAIADSPMFRNMMNPNGANGAKKANADTNG